MARFHVHLRFLSPSPLSKRASVEEAKVEVTGSECDSGDDLVSSPLIPMVAEGCGVGGEVRLERGTQFSLLATAAAALRRSLVLCSLGAGEEGNRASLDIGWPTEVQHISHVTFDRFDGFLGLPVEFLPEIPSKVPSASTSVFGVSAESMQCSHDCRGNSIPTILLSMQRHLYAHGGLQAEGIFRINADNGQELLVREELNKGDVPHGVDLHCLAGLIKAWFRELPNGVLDSLALEQVMHCNTEEECYQLASMLPPTEAALLKWAVNLMADVVEYEHNNKMNARNIAMVFAPNMTQMTNPLTALIHAVQVMNFLKTLILTTLRERASAAAEARQLHSYCGSHRDGDSPDGFEHAGHPLRDVDKENSTVGASYATSSGNLFSTLDSDSDAQESFQSFEKRTEADDTEFIYERWSPTLSDGPKCGDDHRDVEGLLDRQNIKKRVQKLSANPLFQLTRPKNEGDVGVVVSNEGTEAWA